ncbi:MAG: nickel/cobalt transporter (NicO) family protein, partial [Chloroflexota bacterium]|nr:nickel/cobalt transporter (NicO) family protein [Chloroflexota bacterium]
PRAARAARAGLLAVLGVLLLPGLVAAHPLGNFTINHYTGIRVEPGRVLLDVVIDQAEIPTFQARLGFDTDGDGAISAAEIDAGRVAACQALEPSLDLTIGGVRQVLTLTKAGLAFPAGVGGLDTMREVCGFTTAITAPLAAATRIAYADTSYADRLGWREIVVEGSGMTLLGDGGVLRSTTTSARLTHYPTNLLTQALADTRLAMIASPGGPTLADFEIPDAAPLPGAPAAPEAPVTAAAVASVPGGVMSGDLPSIFRSADLSPLVLLISILTAAVLGAGHALTPGHGKTLMAAYLVGTRGTPAHAAGLGLSVTLSHTLGILVLAGLVVGAQGILPPDVVVKGAPVVAAFSIVAIGGWMLFSEGRRRWRSRAARVAQTRTQAFDEGHDHGHDHRHDHGHDHGHDRGHDQGHDDGRATDHAHDHSHGGASHSHGGGAHTHLPAAGATISWRSLFVLGLAGGLIPSTSALLILLGSIAAGRPAFGFLLVVAFGLGMAVVMGGIGLTLVLARSRLDRVDSASRLGRISAVVPHVAGAVVFGFGLYLTMQAVSGTTTF